ARGVPAAQGALRPLSEATDEILAALASPSWTVVRDAVDRAGDVLRAGTPTAAEDAALGNRFLGLAAHPKWEVRKAVARAIEHLRHESFHASLAQLLKDDNAYVRDAAQRTLARRTELSRADLLKAQHGDLLRRWLSDVEAETPSGRPRARK